MLFLSFALLVGAASSNTCVWYEVAGFGMCTSKESYDAMQTPEGQEAAVCSAITGDAVATTCASTENCVVWTDDSSPYDLCLTQTQIDSMQSEEAKEALVCSSIGSETTCNDKSTCEWWTYNGYGMCLSTAQVEAMNTPEAQASMACNSNTNENDCTSA